MNVQGLVCHAMAEFEVLLAQSLVCRKVSYIAAQQQPVQHA